MLRAILNKSWKHHLQNNNCTDIYLPSRKPKHIRQSWFAGQHWKDEDEIMIYVLLRTR